MPNPLESLGFAVGNKVVDSYFNERAAQKAFKRQKELMTFQNDLAVKNWQMENAYNTPAAQKDRLAAAGLNPDLLYGQSGVASMAGDIAAPAVAQSPMANTGVSDIANATQALAVAKNTDSKTVGQEIENYVQNLIKDERIRQIGLQNEWTDEQISNIREATAKLSHEIANIVGQNNLLQKNGELVDAEIVYKQMRTVMEKQEIQSQIQRWKHENGLSDAQAKQITDMLPYLITGQKLANGQDALDFLMDSEYAKAERNIGIVEKGARIIGTALGGTASLRKGRRH